MSFVNIENLSFSYENSREILKNINIKISSNQKVGLIGLNGSGKTTLVNIISGLIEKYNGLVEVDSICLKKKSFDDLRQKIGFVFQNSDDQLFMSKVLDDIKFGLINLDYSDEDAEKIAVEYLRKFELEYLKECFPAHISSGEKKIVSLISVLVMNPQLIIFDEPLIGLDNRNVKKLTKIIKEIEKSMILISHNIGFIKKICDKIILLDHGNLVYFGDSEKFFSDEELVRKYDFD